MVFLCEFFSCTCTSLSVIFLICICIFPVVFGCVSINTYNIGDGRVCVSRKVSLPTRSVFFVLYIACFKFVIDLKINRIIDVLTYFRNLYYYY